PTTTPFSLHSFHTRRSSDLRALSTWPRFGRGWARRVEEVRAAALGFHTAPDRAASRTACPACGKAVAA
ncbi:hypothetical protein ACQKLZ_28505, partial [Methylobacterium tarhaniae]